MTYLFPILLAAMGIYVLYSAIVGRGRLFAMENIKDELKEKAHKLMRLMYFALAAVMILMAIANFGQTVLFSQQVTYYEATDAYKTEFADIITDGKIEYEGKTYTVDGQHDVSEMNALLMAANAKYPDKFTSNTASSPLSCFGASAGSSKIANYYKEVRVTDADGNPVYLSTIKSIRSDANDGSFISKLYKAIPSSLLRILSYVLMGLAVVGVVGVFVLIRKFTDKEKEQKARTYAAGNTMPSSAFNFDDEENKQ